MIEYFVSFISDNKSYIIEARQIIWSNDSTLTKGIFPFIALYLLKVKMSLKRNQLGMDSNRKITCGFIYQSMINISFNPVCRILVLWYPRILIIQQVKLHIINNSGNSRCA